MAEDGCASPTSPAHLAVDCEFYKKKSDKLTEENDHMRESGAKSQRIRDIEDMTPVDMERDMYNIYV